MKTEYHCVGENVSGLDYKIIEKYNLSNDVTEVIKIVNTERAYAKLLEEEKNQDAEATSTIIIDTHNRKVISNPSNIEAATVVLRNDVDEIRENKLAWTAKLVMLFSQLIDHDKHCGRSIKDEEKAKEFFYRHVYQEKQVNLLKAEKDYNCNFELKFIPEEERKQQICQDFCSRLNKLYVDLDLHFKS